MKITLCIAVLVLATCCISLAQVPTQGLIANYPFNGNANDASGNGRNGTVYGATLVPDRFGNPGAAYNFDGVDDYIEIAGTENLHLQTGFTLATWVKCSDFKADQGIIGKHEYGYPNGFSLGMGGSSPSAYDKFHLFICGHFSSPETNRDSLWHCVVGTFNGSAGALYVDGELVASQSVSYHTINSVCIRIAASSSMLSCFCGDIDDVRIYDRPLSQSEVVELYNDNGLIGYWSFDENSGDTAYDYSLNGNNGAISGAQWVNGISGYALYFDGVNDYIDVVDHGSIRPEYITLVAWVKPEGSGGRMILGKSSYISSTNEQYAMHLESDRTVSGNIKRNSGCTAGAGWYRTYSQTELDDYQWYHVMCTWDGNILKQYINGILEDSNTTIPVGPLDDCPGSNLRIGLWWASDPEWYKGTIDEVRIYSQALSQAEVLDLYNSYPQYQEATIIPYNSTGYKYLQVSPGTAPEGFETNAFDDSYFQIGDAGFGYRSVCPLIPSTNWDLNSELILRKNFSLPNGATNLRVKAAIDNDIILYYTLMDIR